MATARDLIKDSMLLLGAIADGENPSAPEAASGLRAANRMLDTWSNESLMVFAKVREEFSLVGLQGSYTMGPSANFDTTRPQFIEAAAIKDVNGFESPVDILTREQWIETRNKLSQTSRPQAIYYEPTYPAGTVYTWPVASIVETLVLYSWKTLAQFATLDANLSMPPGYEEAIVYNLALRLAPTFGKDPSALVVQIAGDSKANIERINSREILLECDPGFLAGCGNYDIYTGGY